MKATEQKQEGAPYYDLAFFPFTMRISTKTYMFIFFLTYLYFIYEFGAKYISGPIGEQITLYTVCFFGFIPVYKFFLIAMDLLLVRKCLALFNIKLIDVYRPTDDLMVNLFYYGRLPKSLLPKKSETKINNTSVQQNFVHQTSITSNTVNNTCVSNTLNNNTVNNTCVTNTVNNTENNTTVNNVTQVQENLDVRQNTFVQNESDGRKEEMVQPVPPVKEDDPAEYYDRLAVQKDKEIFTGLRLYLYQELHDFFDNEQIEQLASTLKMIKDNGFENSLKQIKPISKESKFISKREPNRRLDKSDVYALISNIQYYLPLSLTRQCIIYMKMFPGLFPLIAPKVMQEGVSRVANSSNRKNIVIAHIPFESNLEFNERMLEYSRKTKFDTSTALRQH